LPEGTRFLILAPAIRGQKGEYKDLLEDMLKRGFLRARVDGNVVRLTDDLKLDRRIKHNIEIVIDRLKSDFKIRPRLAEAVEQALSLGEDSLIVSVESEESKVQSPKSKVETARDALDRRVMGILILLPNAPGHSRSLPITPERVPNGRRCRRELSGAIGTDAASWREQSGAWAAGAARCS